MDLDTKRGIAAMREAGLDPADFNTSREFVEAYQDSQARHPRAGDHYRLAAEAVAQKRAQNKRYDELRSKKDEISGYEALSIAFAQPHGSPELEPDPDAPPKKGMQLLKDYFQNQQ